MSVKVNTDWRREERLTAGFGVVFVGNVADHPGRAADEVRRGFRGHNTQTPINSIIVHNLALVVVRISIGILAI